MGAKRTKQFMRVGLVFASLCLDFLASSVSADTPDVLPHYHVVGLPIRLMLEGSHIVNQSGTVVGSIPVPPKFGDDAHNVDAYQWKDGVVSRLKVSEEDLPSSSPAAINDYGQIVGTLDKGNGFTNMHAFGHAFLWEKGKWQDLARLVPDEVSIAVAINNKGTVAINAQTSSIYNTDAPDPDTQHPSYLYRKGRGIFLLGYKRVIALNNKSQVLLSWQGHYYLWDNGRTSEINMPGIGISSSVRDMNDKLQIIGHSQKGAFLYENAQLTFLDRAHESYPNSINNKGQIVGYFYLPKSAESP